MNKILKIAGISLLGTVILFAVFLFLTKTFSRTLNNSTNGYSSFEVNNKGINSLTPIIPDSSLGRQEMAVSLPSVSDGMDVSQDLQQTEKKVIKDGNLNLKVDNADEAVKEISEIAKKNKGEVFTSSFYQTKNNVKSGVITIKVPVASFEKTFAEVKSVASLVIRESISGQDVTEQYVDLQAQLKNRQAEEQSYIKILDRAQKISDVLEVTQQLSRVRGDIEQLQGRMKYLESQTDMSTISANLTEDENVTVVDSWRPWQIVKESFNLLIKGLQGFIDIIIRLIIVIIPIVAVFLIVWVIIIWAIYRAGKKIYLKIKNRNIQ